MMISNFLSSTQSIFPSHCINYSWQMFELFDQTLFLDTTENFSQKEIPSLTKMPLVSPLRWQSWCHTFLSTRVRISLGTSARRTGLTQCMLPLHVVGKLLFFFFFPETLVLANYCTGQSLPSAHFRVAAAGSIVNKKNATNLLASASFSSGGILGIPSFIKYFFGRQRKWTTDMLPANIAPFSRV